MLACFGFVLFTHFSKKCDNENMLTSHEVNNLRQLWARQELVFPVCGQGSRQEKHGVFDRHCMESFFLNCQAINQLRSTSLTYLNVETRLSPSGRFKRFINSSLLSSIWADFIPYKLPKYVIVSLIVKSLYKAVSYRCKVMNYR